MRKRTVCTSQSIHVLHPGGLLHLRLGCGITRDDVRSLRKPLFTGNDTCDSLVPDRHPPMRLGIVEPKFPISLLTTGQSPVPRTQSLIPGTGDCVFISVNTRTSLFTAVSSRHSPVATALMPDWMRYHAAGGKTKNRMKWITPLCSLTASASCEVCQTTTKL